jgi:hypothetical protein
MSTFAAIADVRLTRDGREWHDKGDWQHPSLPLAQVALFALGARSGPIRDEPS